MSLSQLSIKTRIETDSGPVKGFLPIFRLSQLSIKTRIETPSETFQSLQGYGLSQLSIKTRIETILPQVIWHHFCV